MQCRHNSICQFEFNGVASIVFIWFVSNEILYDFYSFFNYLRIQKKNKCIPCNIYDASSRLIPMLLRLLYATRERPQFILVSTAAVWQFKCYMARFALFVTKMFICTYIYILTYISTTILRCFSCAHCWIHEIFFKEVTNQKFFVNPSKMIIYMCICMHIHLGDRLHPLRKFSSTLPIISAFLNV